VWRNLGLRRKNRLLPDAIVDVGGEMRAVIPEPAPMPKAVGTARPIDGGLTRETIWPPSVTPICRCHAMTYISRKFRNRLRSGFRVVGRILFGPWSKSGRKKADAVRVQE